MIRSRYCQGAFGVGTAILLLAGCDGTSRSTSLPAQTIHAFSSRPLSDHGYQLLYSFKDGLQDGRAPMAGLTRLKGTLYGTTSSGGTDGTVFSISTTGAEKVLYSFSGRPDGSSPYAGLTVVNGVLYGTTYYGGKGGGTRCFQANPNPGCGTVFAITTSGTETVLHAFGGGSDGSAPMCDLLALHGELYGTTTGLPFGHGTLFVVSTSGRERVLYRFQGGSNDGSDPEGNLVVRNGKIYGVTYEGGTANVGTVFMLDKSGNERVLHSFTKAEGDYPRGGLTELNGAFYGTTSAEGPHRRGAVFSITPDGHFHVIYGFRGYARGDGTFPYARLIAVNGMLYGTTRQGGLQQNGTVFKISPTGSEQVLYSFGFIPDGIDPWAPLVDLNGELYGTTFAGGQYNQSYGDGTVFKISP